MIAFETRRCSQAANLLIVKDSAIGTTFRSDWRVFARFLGALSLPTVDGFTGTARSLAESARERAADTSGENFLRTGLESTGVPSYGHTD